MTEQWKILSWNHDVNNIEFVSSIEHKKYPFYGTQYHPEKVLYEWIPEHNIAHSPNAVLVSQWFSNFFVDQSRRNMNKFSDSDELDKAIIYNFQPIFTGLIGSAFEQCYLFENDSDHQTQNDAPENNSPEIEAPINDAPIIGVLVQEMSDKMKINWPNENSYIAASYVKSMEGGGARVVPIW